MLGLGPYIPPLVYLVDVVIAGSIGYLAYEKRDGSGLLTALFVLHVITGLSALAYFVRTFATADAVVAATTVVGYAGMIVVSPVWVYLILLFVGSEPARWQQAVLVGVPLSLIGALVTNPLHGLYYTGFERYTYEGLISYVRLQPNPLFGIQILFGNLFWVSGVYLLAQYIRKTERRTYQFQAIIILISGSVPAIFDNSLNLLGIYSKNWADPLLVGFSLSALLMAWAVYKNKFGDVVPIAHNRIVSSLDDGILVINDDGRIVDTNAGIVEYLSGFNSGVEAMTEESLIGRDARAVLPEQVHSLVESGERGKTVLQDTQEGWYVAQTNPIEVRGKTGIVVLTVTDITDQKRKQAELERQNERLDEFAEVVSHDLRNQITVVHGNADLVGEWTADPAIEDRAETVVSASSRMNTIIEDVLELARKGRTISEPAEFNLGTLARETWDLMDTADAELTVTTDLEIRGDRSRVRNIFENLYANAVEHGSTSHRPASDDALDQRRDVSVEVHSLEDGSGFYVADDGPGFPEWETERLLQKGTTTKPGGTGFGLAIVAEIADAHGWEVDLTDSDTGGARIEFRNVELEFPYDPSTVIPDEGKTVEDLRDEEP